jgi:hypothetical protein
MAKIMLDRDVALDILRGCSERYELISDEIEGQSRWATDYELIFLDKETKKYYQGYYSRGSTEMQAEAPWEYEAPEFSEVEPVEVMTIVYKVVK